MGRLLCRHTAGPPASSLASRPCSAIASNSRGNQRSPDTGRLKLGTSARRPLLRRRLTLSAALAVLGLLAASPDSLAQALVSGRLLGSPWPGANDLFPYAGICCFDSMPGPGHAAVGFRTWEMEPTGWFRFSTDAGNHTLLFTGPAHFMRPIVLNNIFLRPGEQLDHLRPSPHFDFTNFFEGAWDPKPATDYFQTFVAGGRSVTSVGFRLASDGVDGAGPQSQNFLVSLHRRMSGTPDTWPQVGPARLVPNIDCGGAKNGLWYAGWNSGEVPLVPAETYAVHLRPEKPGATFQAFWRRDDDRSADCFRIGPGNIGFQGHDLWLAVAADGDGLLIPYNKCVHTQFGQFAGFASKWSQTYRAQGRSLASVILYAAVGGAQPPLSRQRLAVRIRRDGPGGEVCGVEKAAIGNGNYTGDASWGTFGVAFAPGEVPLLPGQTYAIEFESLESLQTLHGFVNIKGQLSDDRPGFNPYLKAADDVYDHGTACKSGREKMPFSLDLQVIEYEFASASPSLALEGPNLLANGDMEQWKTSATTGPNLTPPSPGRSGLRPVRASETQAPADWKPFALQPQTQHALMSDPDNPSNHFACVFANGGEPADGGFVQRVDALTPTATYRLEGRARCTWATDFEHQCLVGLDSTGQDANPQAPTIVWTTLSVPHGLFSPFTADPTRPATNSISVWLRARSSWKADPWAPSMADFDKLTLRQVRTSPPNGF
jgi:hypothetical protein